MRSVIVDFLNAAIFAAFIYTADRYYSLEFPPEDVSRGFRLKTIAAIEELRKAGYQYVINVDEPRDKWKMVTLSPATPTNCNVPFETCICLHVRSE